MIYVTDAHAMIWFVVGSLRLGAKTKTALNDPKSELVLPATAYAEVCWILQHGRIPGYTLKDVQSVIDTDPRFSVRPLGRAVIDRSHGLTVIREMHDRQIVATALVLADAGEAVALLTHDDNITAAGVVSVVW